MFNKTVEKWQNYALRLYQIGSVPQRQPRPHYERLNQKWETVEINTPKGWVLDLVLHDQTFSDHEASCSVVKDSGDDPDVTNGVKIFAKITPSDQDGSRLLPALGLAP